MERQRVVGHFGHSSRTHGHPPLARALFAQRWVDFAPRLDRLRYFGKPSAFTSGASDFRHNILWFRSFHKNRF